ncbi:MAG TPA: formyltransferase family protein, partial [Polyangiaceae bacterium]|nr:formyltransferase family protein [Polyangiaceae bacterium]
MSNPHLTLAYFGLPLGAYLLARDGHEFSFTVLPALPGPGRRRLRHLLRERVLDAAVLGPALDQAVECAWAGAEPDLLVSWFWPRRLPEQWLIRPPLGAIGTHPSLLPRHRGPNPYYWAIDSGDLESGVTVHRLTAEFDRGAILASAKLAIGERNAWQLARALDRPSLQLMRETVAALARGEQRAGKEQNEALATWAPEPDTDELKVSWQWSTARVLRRIRALGPVPGLAIEIRGVRLFVTAGRAASEFPAALYPGEAATLPGPPAQVVIRTGDGALSIEEALLNTDTDADPAPLTGAEV